MKYILLSIVIILMSAIIAFPEDTKTPSQVDMISENQADSSRPHEFLYPMTMDELEEMMVIDSTMPPHILMQARAEILPYSVTRIVKDLKLFGVYEDSTSNPQLEYFIRNEIDSIKSEESVEPLYKLDEVWKRYSFMELQCLKMYIFKGPPMTSFTGILFNACDSTIYPFKGCAPRFSKVIRKHLPEIVQNNKLIDLINLYLNASSGGNAYFIISGIEDYKDIWQNAIAEEVLPQKADTLRAIAEKDIESLRESMFLINIHESDNKNGRYFDIKLETWEWGSGKIETWKFRVSDSVFEVRTRFAIYLEKGPCYKNLRQY